MDEDQARAPGHPGVGSTGHLATALLAQALGVEVTTFPIAAQPRCSRTRLAATSTCFSRRRSRWCRAAPSGAVKVFGITSKDTSPQFPACRASSRPMARSSASTSGRSCLRPPHAEARRRCHRRRIAGCARRSGNPESLGRERQCPPKEQRTPAGATAYLQERDRALGPGGARQQDRGAGQLTPRHRRVSPAIRSPRRTALR